MADEPIMLDLAQLPREKLGPFLLLGLSKTATKKEVEKHWAERLKWARRNAIKVPLEDINWARELVTEPQQRASADAASLTTDLADGSLEELAAKYGLISEAIEPTWEPMSSEMDLTNYEPKTESPSIESVQAQIELPEIPEEMLSVKLFLEPLRMADLDPWEVELPT